MSLTAICIGYEVYQAKLPNGGTTPNPCKKGTLWVGLGHMTPMGGGNRNKFATDFHDVYGEVSEPFPLFNNLLKCELYL